MKIGTLRMMSKFLLMKTIKAENGRKNFNIGALDDDMMTYTYK